MSLVSPVTPCFTPGTRIGTDKGTLAIENVRRGMKVVTRDNGLRTVYWTGHRVVPYHEIGEEPALAPILIRRGSCGDGRPFRDMLVSPAHRMLVTSDIGLLAMDEPEVLVAAEMLVGLPGIERASTLGVSYHHLLCDRHQIILADGAWTESFHPDDATFALMGDSQRNEILSVFPEVATVGASRRFSAARLLLDKREAQDS